MSDTLTWAVAVLSKACEAGMYGRVTIILEGGKPIRVMTETSETAPRHKSDAIPFRPGFKDIPR